MNSQVVVIVQVLIAGTFILWILSRKGSTPKPTSLNMSDSGNKQDTHKVNQINTLNQITPKYDIKKYNRPYVVDEIQTSTKMLNVIFMWNGHSWDAFEVFGLPAGTTMEKVNERYRELYSKSDTGQQQFLNAAKSAIEKKSVSA